MQLHLLYESIISHFSDVKFGMELHHKHRMYLHIL